MSIFSLGKSAIEVSIHKLIGYIRYFPSAANIDAKTIEDRQKNW